MSSTAHRPKRFLVESPQPKVKRVSQKRKKVMIIVQNHVQNVDYHCHIKKIKECIP